MGSWQSSKNAHFIEEKQFGKYLSVIFLYVVIGKTLHLHHQRKTKELVYEQVRMETLRRMHGLGAVGIVRRTERRT